MSHTKIVLFLMWILVPIALALIFLVTVNSIEYKAVSIIFLFVSYILASVMCLYATKVHQSVLKWTVYLCALGYFTVNLMLSVVFLYILNVDWPFIFTILLLITVCFLLLSGFLYITNQKTEQQIEKQQVKANKVVLWRQQVKLQQAEHPSKELQQLSDLLAITPIANNSSVDDLDVEISILLDELPEKTELVIKKIKERNIRLKENG